MLGCPDEPGLCVEKNVLKCTIQSLTFQCKKNEDEDTKLDDTRVVTSQDIYIHRTNLGK